MQSTRFALVSALLLAGAAPILGAAGRPPPPRRGRRPRRAMRRGASTSPRATFRSSRATISGATPTTPGSSTTRSRPTAPPGASAPSFPRTSRRSCTTSSRPPIAAPIRSAARSPTCMRAGWTRPGSSSAAPRVLRPYLDRIAAAQTRDDLIRLFAKPGFPSPIGIGITPNPADPTHYVVGTVPGRARHAQPRLLSARGRPVRRLSRRLPHLSDHHPAARRHRRSGSQGRRDHRARAPHRRGALDARAQPRRHPVDQPDDAGPARRARAAMELAAGAARAAVSAMSPTIIVRQTIGDPGRGAAVRGGAAADLEGLADLPLHPQLRPIPAARLRRGQFRILFAHAARPGAASATAGSAASTCSTARSARRSAGSTSSATSPTPAAGR